MTPGPPTGFAPVSQSGSFIDLVGPVYVREEGGVSVIGLRVGEDHRNAAGAVHGGLMATLVDFALGRTIRGALDGDGIPVTVSLTTDFLGAVEVGDWLEAHCDLEQLGRRLAFADCSLRVGDREVVRGRAVFAVLS